ncbi:flagellar basal body rod protein FlgB [Geothrix limicola]|uniref:Flagellar basal body rod protein FlgB n=1 Tax=Geothrix limicola TaxID=2927978 RepID=A0ABQ5QHC0_9BACT|nr:flagellar basal body rod protein FlgB [Geothrix limicola]GLH73821.1 flagellar basal body rod protein FlgB [Geothrix limicola]
MFDLTSGNGMIQAMDRGLSLASQRQTLIASNLANIDTPGYRTRDFSFEGAMKSALSGQTSPNTLTTTNPMHLQGSPSASLPPSTDPIQPSSERNDGNDVSLDRENMLLARTQMTYQNASTFMQVELRKLYFLIREASAH